MLADPMTTSIKLSSGGLFAERGVAQSGRIEFDGPTGIVVKGHMNGTVAARSFGYIHIAGDLQGTVEVDAPTTIVIDRDLAGSLVLRSNATVVLRGRLVGSLDPRSIGTIYFQHIGSRSDLAAMRGNFSQYTAHVRYSDMPEGRVIGPVGTWREVIVADPVWKKLAR